MTRQLLLLSFIALGFLTGIARAQEAGISGTVIDATDSTPLINANVVVMDVRDSTQRHGIVTDKKGSFAITGLEKTKYRLRITYLGYLTFDTVITVRRNDEQLGKLALRQDAVRMDEVEVVSILPNVETNKDTVQYMAKAFKTNPDATAEDLVAKMPGWQVDKAGTPKHAGENIKRVLQDGKQVFGDDPTIAMRNIPAEVIDKVQVFDKMSDQAQLTGFDDGNSEKTINFITKAAMRNGVFGKANAGYGTADKEFKDNKYTAGLTMNLFKDDLRLTFLGMSNNINNQNFSFQDILGVAGIGSSLPPALAGAVQAGIRMFGGRGGGFGGRGGGGGGAFGMMGGGGMADFFIGQQNGINTTHSAGLNYSDKWAEGMNVTGSYFFNYTNNRTENLLRRQYFLTGLTSQYYDEANNGESNNRNHRINMRMEWDIDTSNSIIFQPRASVQSNGSYSNVTGTTSLGETQMLSNALTHSSTDVEGYNVSQNIVYRHKFATKGRTISLNFSSSANNRNSDNFLYSLTDYFVDTTGTSSHIDQKSLGTTKGFSLSGNLTYTEATHTNGLLSLTYTSSLSKNTNDKSTDSLDEASLLYTKPVPDLSNYLESNYVTNVPGIGYRLRGDSWNALVQLTYQMAELKGDQTIPSRLDIRRNFYNFLPMANISWRVTPTSNISFNYRSNTNAPSVTQLQNIVDNSNPLQLTTGNPDLRQSFSQSVVARFNVTSSDRAQSLFGFLYVGQTDQNIGNNTILALNDSTLYGGVILKRGAQLSYPVNVDGYKSLRSLLTYSIPMKFISSNVNFTAGYNLSRSPGFINGASNVATTNSYIPGLVISSNISENLDFTMSYMGNKNIVKNTISAQLDNEYYSHNISARLNWIFWAGFVFRSDITNQYYTGLQNNYNQDQYLWNLSIGKKFLADNAAEITLSAYDILKQNKNSFRTVTESYIEDQHPNVLTQYFLLTFSYTLKSFAGEPPRMRDREGHGPPGFGF